MAIVPATFNFQFLIFYYICAFKLNKVGIKIMNYELADATVRLP
jgi:hypothetical protein